MKISPILKTIVIAALVGVASGVIGAAISDQYIISYLASLQPPPRTTVLSQEKPKPSPGSYDEAIGNARRTLMPAVVTFYPSSTDGSVVPSSALGAGVVVTSDGWVATTSEALSGATRAVVGTTVYTFSASVSDPLSDLAMVKLKEATGLPVIPFGSSAQVSSGDQAFVGVSASGIIPTAIVDADHWIARKASNSAQSFVTDFALADQVVTPGAPVVNENGELIAITMALTQGQAAGVGAMPFDHLLNAVKSVIQSGKVVRASFGASITDIALVHEGDALTHGLQRGALVDALTSGGPAALAGIQKGDIITRLGDVTLDNRTSLSDVLADYKPGDSVPVVVQRAGAEQTFTVQLGS